MVIRFHVSRPGGRGKGLRGVDIAFNRAPQTVEELLCEAVSSCVAAFNARVASSSSSSAAHPLSEACLADMAAVGKIAFGLLPTGKARAASEPEARAAVLQAYEDGLIRVFIGNAECGALGDGIDLHEHDSVTFLRLTMLTGGFL